MKYKKLAFEYSFLCLLIWGTAVSPVLSYDFGSHPVEDLIWKCNICKNESLYTIFGIEWSNDGFLEQVDQGRFMKWSIISRENDGTRLNLTTKIWKWQEENTWADYDEIKSYWYYVDPNQYSSNYNFSKNLPFIKAWLPLPMSEYMNNLELNQIYDIDDRVLFTINIQLEKDYISSGIPSKTINMIALYNENGFLSTFKIYLPGNIVLLEISLIFIPIYTIPVVVGIFSTLVAVILYYFLKLRSREIK